MYPRKQGELLLPIMLIGDVIICSHKNVNLKYFIHARSKKFFFQPSQLLKILFSIDRLGNFLNGCVVRLSLREIQTK